jgi:RimJ/RimL family protein N-acetyltransferase
VSPRVHIETERLRLRDWVDEDAEPFAAINVDPRVMEFFSKRLTREQSDAFLAGNRANIAADGWGLYAVEEKASGKFVGYVGLARPGFEAHFTPAIEIGWRLARSAWGAGCATEAARAVVDHAFGVLDLDALVSFTTEWNQPSRRVMEKIGMSRDPREDFLHPRVPPDHKLAPHVLYRIDRKTWRTARQATVAPPASAQ